MILVSLRNKNRLLLVHFSFFSLLLSFLRLCQHLVYKLWLLISQRLLRVHLDAKRPGVVLGMEDDDDIKEYLAARRKRFPKADAERPAVEKIEVESARVEKSTSNKRPSKEQKRTRTLAMTALQDRCEGELLVEALKYLCKEYSIY